jgi:1-acyl-sn-glycerol-3-phosphate acyltransferase
MGMRQLRPPPPIVRRLLRLVWPVLALTVTVVALPLLVIGAVWSLVDRRARLFRATGLTLLVVWLDVQLLLGCWRLRLADPLGDGPTWKDDHERLLLDVLDTAIRVGRTWVGFDIRLDTVMDLGEADRPLIAFARHAGPADSLAVAWLLSRTGGRLPRIVLADALRWDPGIDLILTRLGSSFVPSASGAGDDRLTGVRRLADSLDPTDALLIFPEGENWTPNRRERLITRLRTAGQQARLRQAELLRNVLPPKTKGAIATLSARPDADVMIVAHAGLGRIDGPRAIYDAIPFRRPFLVRTWTYAAVDVPREPAAIEAWLVERWHEIDTWVDAQDE